MGFVRSIFDLGLEPDDRVQLLKPVKGTVYSPLKFQSPEEDEIDEADEISEPDQPILAPPTPAISNKIEGRDTVILSAPASTIPHSINHDSPFLSVRESTLFAVEPEQKIPVTSVLPKAVFLRAIHPEKCREMIHKFGEYELKSPPPPKTKDNPFRDQPKVDIRLVEEFFKAQTDRIYIGNVRVYQLLPNDIRKNFSPASIAEFLKFKNRKLELFPGRVAEALWDTYSQIPGQYDPVLPDEAFNLLSLNAPNKPMINADLAHYQLNILTRYTGMTAAAFFRALKPLGVSRESLYSFTDRRPNVHAVTRLPLAYCVALVSSEYDLPPYPVEKIQRRKADFGFTLERGLPDYSQSRAIAPDFMVSKP